MVVEAIQLPLGIMPNGIRFAAFETLHSTIVALKGEEMGGGATNLLGI